jgi:hypothetical protein
MRSEFPELHRVPNEISIHRSKPNVQVPLTPTAPGRQASPHAFSPRSRKRAVMFNQGGLATTKISLDRGTYDELLERSSPL